MNHNRSFFVLIIQSIVIAGLLILEFNDDASGGLRWTLFAALCFTSAFLFFTRFRTRTRLKQMTAELRRATNGNLKTRLFAKDDDVWNEVIFSINELLEQLENIQIETIKSQAARRSLLSNISHDIRTPLTSIIGYVNALKDDIAISEEEKQEYIEIISKKSNGLKELIDEIFMIAKLDADEMPHKPVSLDLAEMIRESLIAFLPELNKNEIDLHVSIPDEKCLIHADHLSVMRIIGNIIKNAIYYGGEGKVIGVELTQTAQEHQLLIWDRGPGISKVDIANVFERMYRADQARTLIKGGSGLGLAIAKALIEKNGGAIWVESEPWQKTVFGTSFKKLLKNR
ncbi:His Kinase A (phospho-acceptor) domain-containing protein [Paenibacillus algorifonticola]|uniref:histidine kinase n=1 Tax=Paenibacillus algorifonticola TaxID=684063 RepID=A0A1I1Y532_9BACL|nr:HAMP domain-containing sensor histidine kinase [Paenibacillus algorifonticola]SFE14785.1 His Kinase A (phospho-acceptor) domain-containing protein [Paenibacillus algorifonticola]